MSDYGQGHGHDPGGYESGSGYGSEPYGDPYAPEYGTPEYGTAEYGSGDYGAAGHGYGNTERLPEPPAGGSNRKILTILGGVIAVCVVLLVLALAGVFDFADKTSGTPRSAATAVLEAARTHDVDAARKVLCQMDLDGGTAGSIASMTITTYSVDAVAQGSSSATVTATITNGGSNVAVPIPLIKEKGAWKVCLPVGSNLTGAPGTGTNTGSSGSSGATSGTVSAPPASTPVPSFSVPSDIGSLNVCQSATSAQQTAQLFVGAIIIGSTELAQGCVFNHQVPDATVAAIVASQVQYSQTSTSGNTFVYQSSDGAKKLTIQVTKESDGHFYVTGLTQG